MFLHGPALAAFIVFLFLGALPFAARADSVFTDGIQVSIVPEGADTGPYLQRVRSCLTTLGRAATTAFGEPQRFRLQSLRIDSTTEVAAGSAGPDSLSLFGPPDQATACHEVFHVFEIQASQNKLMARKKTSSGKTSPLYEALPQVFAVLSTGDCLIGREGRFEFAYDHCQLLNWNHLPTLRESATEERRLARARNAETSYWDAILNNSTDEQLSSPSAYYMSIPMAAALHRAAPVCGRDVLIEVLLKTYAEQSHLPNNSFDSIKTFAPEYLRALELRSSRPCARQLRRDFSVAGLL